MNLKIRDSHRSLAISLGVHALLLIFMAFYVIPPMVATRWHEIIIGPPATDFVETSDEIGPGAAQPVPQGSPVQPQTQKAKSTQTPKTASPEKSEVKTTPQSTHSSDLVDPIDLPDVREGQSKTQAAIPTNPLNPLKGIPFGKTQPSPGGRVNYSIFGGSVRFVPRQQTHKLGESGRAVITFRLDRNAGLVRYSIDAGENSGPRFFDEAKRILEEGRFEYIGTPNPNALYTITITFSI